MSREGKTGRSLWPALLVMGNKLTAAEGASGLRDQDWGGGEKGWGDATWDEEAAVGLDRHEVGCRGSS
jgi:hypothetical protein